MIIDANQEDISGRVVRLTSYRADSQGTLGPMDLPLGQLYPDTTTDRPQSRQLYRDTTTDRATPIRHLDQSRQFQPHKTHSHPPPHCLLQLCGKPESKNSDATSFSKRGSPLSTPQPTPANIHPRRGYSLVLG